MRIISTRDMLSYSLWRGWFNNMIDKAIQHGKEHRQPYYNSGRFDLTCRPHGGCPWCESNRFHSIEVQKDIVADTLHDIDYLEDIDILDRSFERFLDN
jgi:hypothetical protein